MTAFYRRWSTLMGAGTPVVAALDFLARSEDNLELREHVHWLANEVNKGHRLSVVMARPRLAPVFDSVAVGFINVGEQTGRLHHAIDRLAELTERQQRLRDALASALAYPLILLASMLVLALLFVLILGSRDAQLFGAFGGELPVATRVLVAASDFLKDPARLLLWSAYSVGLVLVARFFYRRDETIRRRVHEWFLNMPVVGSLVRKTLAARMLRVLVAAVAVGVPMRRGLQLAEVMCTNLALLEAYQEAQASFVEGTDLSDALQEYHVFPPLVTAMIRLAQESGRMERIMVQVADLFEDDVETTVNAAAKLVEPMLLCVAGVFTGFLALAALQPILEFANRV